jgi:acyl-homoserine-lactone acylase
VYFVVLLTFGTSMKLPGPLLRLIFTAFALLAAVGTRADDLARWRQQARNVTLIRDAWGIPHIHGKTDADAVFGFLYAQAEDDFPRIELNYINALGRLAEIEGEAELYRDLRMKLFVDPDDLRAKFTASPPWLQALMNAFADGLNFYLHTHPNVKPRLITRFEPWMALSFSEGSIGGDIESIALPPLQHFYGDRAEPLRPADPPSREGGGSNGFAVAPKNTANGHALLLINPHTTFYFRPEVHVSSDQGLNAYGAVTWGQFFVYQGFNDRCGWMHTSDGADVIDEYMESVVERPAGPAYRYGDDLRPFTTRKLVLPYKTSRGRQEKVVTAYFSHHGPIIRETDGKWIAVKLLQDPVRALSQSYLRTKARNYSEFLRTMDLRTNTSNNTVYADADGTIAYFHGNFVPVRDPRFDWRNPVDGSDPATEWRGVHPVSETITILNPSSGWIQNTNNWPFSAAGLGSSPLREKYPAYMWTNPENARGLNAMRVLRSRKDFTLDRLITAAYDSTLLAFAKLLAALHGAYDALPADAPQRATLAEPIAALRPWNLRSSTDSVPTTLAILWAQELSGSLITEAKKKGLVVIDHIVASTTAAQQLDAFSLALSRLQRDFGTWKVPWGEVNRFQRLTGDVNQTFDDARPSLPIPFAPGDWGSLPAFGPAPSQTTKRLYGVRGNSFVAVVEFGPKVAAKSLLAGGVSGDPASPHFNDQAGRYARGEFKDVLFHRNDVVAGAKRTYHPGE